MRCKNGLHEIDPTDPWRAPNGARCRECYLEVQTRYNESEKGRERWLRYEEGSVGHEHRTADDLRKMGQRLDAALGRFESEFGERPSWEEPQRIDGRPHRSYVPDYNGARKTDAIRAKQRELGWDWVRASKSPSDFSIKFVPVRPDAAPSRVVKEVCALYRMRPASRFKRRERAA